MARTDITDRRITPARRCALPPWGRRRRIWWACGIKQSSFGSYCEHSKGSIRLRDADVHPMAPSPLPRIDEFFVLHRDCGVDSVDVWPDPEIEAPGLHRLHTRCAVCGAVESELIRVSAIEAYHRAIDDNATLI